MNSNKGITLMSLVIYVVGMVIIIGIIASLTSFFYKNVNVEEVSSNPNQYTEFSSVFLKEINNKNNTIIECKTSTEDNVKTSYIIFSSGNQYTFISSNNSVYKNNIKISENVQDCEFSYWLTDSIYYVKVNFKTDNMDMTGDNAIVYSIK